MVLYLTEGLLTESVSGDEVINAIDNRVGVLITYEGENNPHTGKRYIEPYVYGATSRNNQAIRAYQYYGDTKKGAPKWKLFRLDRIQSWEPTNNHFELEPKARGWAAQAFHGYDKSLPIIYRVVELGEEPQTDYERLMAITKQIQQNKPININQLNKPTEVNKPKQNVQKGPIGSNKPQTGISNPEANKEPKQAPNPLNNNGEPKLNTSQSPVKQEPKQNGPIIGNASNPDENKAEDLMSNDQFRDMLKRNLEITRKEKEKRGFDLNNGDI